MLLKKNMMHQPTYMSQTVNEIDNVDLLPTDDQLNQLVDSLCENFPTLKLKLDFDENSTPAIQQNIGTINVCEQIVDEPVYSDFHVKKKTPCNSPKEQRVLKIETVTHVTRTPGYNFDEILLENKYTKASAEKRSSSNSCLNVAIMQCSNSLDHLIDKRKSLEFLVKVQHNVTNNNYNFSYTPRLPDMPTRVDRLIHDVSQERCRILALMSLLENTMNLFTSKSTRDNMRQLLLAYGKAIIEVIKERQSEINYSSSGADYETRVYKLARFIDIVNWYTRQVHTALWCIEVKEQMNMVMSQKRPSNQLKKINTEHKNNGTSIIAMQNPWQIIKNAQQPQQQKQVQQKFQKVPQSPKILRGSNGCGQQYQKKSRQLPMCMGMVHQQTNIYQVIPSSSFKARKSSIVQLHTQQPRAETFERYSSWLKNSRNSVLK